MLRESPWSDQHQHQQAASPQAQHLLEVHRLLEAQHHQRLPRSIVSSEPSGTSVHTRPSGTVTPSPVTPRPPSQEMATEEPGPRFSGTEQRTPEPSESSPQRRSTGRILEFSGSPQRSVDPASPRPREEHVTSTPRKDETMREEPPRLTSLRPPVECTQPIPRPVEKDSTRRPPYITLPSSSLEDAAATAQSHEDTLAPARGPLGARRDHSIEVPGGEHAASARVGEGGLVRDSERAGRRDAVQE